VPSQNNPHSVIIIGGGLAGLATAALLGKLGWQVTIFEKNTTLGGRARVFKKKGFTFDMGPSWYMMPEVFERYFGLLGKNVKDLYQLVRLDPRYSIFFGQEPKVVFPDSIEKTTTWFESLEPGAGHVFTDYLKRMQLIYQAVSNQLLYEDWWSWRSWFKFQNLKAMFQLVWLQRFWQSWQAEVSHLFAEPKLQKALSFLSVFLGGSPYNTPALYSMLNWADIGEGIWYPKGGMNRLVAALERVAIEQGVNIKTGMEVTEILIKDKQVTGIRAGGVTYETTNVVGACDIPWLETQLLPPPFQVKASAWDKKTLGISALMIYLGLNKRLSRATHHMLYLADDWQENFKAVFESKSLPSDPSLYVSVRSVTDRQIVPKGCEEVAMLIPLGAGGSYTNKELQGLADHAIEKLEHLLKEKIKTHILVKELYRPSDFEVDYHAHRGTALGLAHTLRQSVWFRPSIKHPSIKGLWYAGQYSHPGIGVPMALISAELVANSIGQPAVASARQIFKKGSVTYYYSSIFFPGPIREQVATLYAYVRVIDDLVDQQKPDVAQMDKMWRDTVTAWKTGRAEFKVVGEFVALAKRQHFKWQWITAFWWAMRQDIKPKKYRSFSELEKYMFGSAEVIGLMMARVLELSPAAQAAAQAQGKAMQLINFVRDVAEDEALGRNYLGYSQAQKQSAERWNNYIRTVIDRYFKLQQQAESGYDYIPKHYLIPIKSAADMYNWTARRLYENPSLVWQKKLKPSKVRVVSTVVKNMIQL
jgi:phytoene desaturase